MYLSRVDCKAYGNSDCVAVSDHFFVSVKKYKVILMEGFDGIGLKSEVSHPTFHQFCVCWFQQMETDSSTSSKVENAINSNISNKVASSLAF